MKKLLLLFLFIIITSFANAQDLKPTKEVTLKFINNTLGKVVGMNGNMDNRIESQVIIDIGDITTLSKSKNGKSTIKEVYTQIKWEDLVEIDTDVSSEEFSKQGNAELILMFTTKCQNRTFISDKFFQSDFIDGFSLIIPKDKFESLKKAFERLAEIAKEENKDPFKN